MTSPSDDDRRLLVIIEMNVPTACLQWVYRKSHHLRESDTVFCVLSSIVSRLWVCFYTDGFCYPAALQHTAACSGRSTHGPAGKDFLVRTARSPRALVRRCGQSTCGIFPGLLLHGEGVAYLAA